MNFVKFPSGLILNMNYVIGIVPRGYAFALSLNGAPEILLAGKDADALEVWLESHANPA